MTEVSLTRPGLADKEIWIVDDSLPVDQLSFDKDDLLDGSRPIDRGTLRDLLRIENWNEIQVKDLCNELFSQALNVTAFIQPNSAVDYLNRGATVPDAVIFDLKHRNTNPEQVQTSLRSLLSASISVIQVYTHESLDEAKEELKILLSEFPGRLAPPRNKAETDVKSLADVIRQQLDKSLSAQLARELRKLSSQAVETVLVKIDDIPDSTLLHLLGGQEEGPEEFELVELLSVKVSEALASASGLAEAVQQYLKAKGIPEENRGEMVRSIADIVVANARESVRNSGGLLALAQTWEHASLQKTAAEAEDQSKCLNVVKDFFQFRAYTVPPTTDRLVLTGDIVTVAGKENVEANSAFLPDLYLVLTPLCDLAHFWKKTRGILTLARMTPIDERGSEEIWKYSKKKFGTEIKSFPGSITAANPMLLPSARLIDGRSADYALFARELLVEDFPMLRDTKADRPLTYAALEGRIVRQCRISQPFLGGILDEIRHVLFRFGIPDFPEQEKTRMATQFNVLKSSKVIKEE